MLTGRLVTSSTTITGPEIRPSDSRTLSVEGNCRGWLEILSDVARLGDDQFFSEGPSPTRALQANKVRRAYLFLAVQALPLQDTFSAMRVTPQVVTQSNRFPLSALRTRKTQLGPMVNIGLGRRELG